VNPCLAELTNSDWLGRTAEEYPEIVRRLRDNDDESVPRTVVDYLAGNASPFRCEAKQGGEREFVVMCALDEVAGYIHPAFNKRLPARSQSKSGMLHAMRRERTLHGAYARTAAGFVVPKGHLEARSYRPDDDATASGTELGHNFAYLTVVSSPDAGRSIRFVVPSPTKFYVPQSRADRVGVAPIAEEAGDLSFEVSAKSGRAYVDARPTAGIDFKSRIGETVTALLDGGAGIIVLPELVAPSGHVPDLVKMLGARAASTPALIVAGSGASDSHPNGQRPFNEAAIVTAEGQVLGVQRKLNLFNMNGQRMEQCGIAPAHGCVGKFHKELASVGTEQLVFDLAGLGRVMVLICEDFEQEVPGGDVAREARPDWILSPVLDISQDAGRWTHTRAIVLGRKTYSRIVVSNSTSVAVRFANKPNSRTDPINCAICLDGLAGDKVHLVPVRGSGSPEHHLIEWHSDGWPRHKLDIDNPAA
jgi:hypothetical protein